MVYITYIYECEYSFLTVLIMGVKNLNQILKRHSSNTIKSIFLQSDIRGKVVGIDASIYLYKSVYMSNKNNKPNHYIHLFLHQIMDLLEQNTTPIYVFDGKPPEVKQDEILRRREKKEKSIADVKVLEDSILVNKTDVKNLKQKLKLNKQTDGLGVDAEMELQESICQLQSRIQKQKTKLKSKQDSCIRITESHVAHVKRVLDIMGIPYIQGVEESDPLLAQLCKEGLVDMVLSDDMDYLALQTPILLKRNNNQDEHAKTAFDRYSYTDVTRSLQLSNEEFIDLCVLCGCDYVDPIPRIGAITAYKLILKHRSIETILLHLDTKKYPLVDPVKYMEGVCHARSCFQMKYKHTLKASNLTCSPVNIELFRTCLTHFCTFGKYKENVYVEFLKNRNDSMM